MLDIQIKSCKQALPTRLLKIVLPTSLVASYKVLAPVMIQLVN
jgi:hypothetical protein